MKFVLLIIAATATFPAYAGFVIRSLPALDEFGLITLALVVGALGARAIQRYRGRRKTDD